MRKYVSLKLNTGIGWVGLVLMLMPAQASALSPEQGNELNENLEVIGDIPADDAKKTEKKKRSLLIVPIPQSSPTLGTGLTVAASLFYNPNNAREPWITGIGAMKTSNGSQAIGALHKMTLSDDKHRITVFAGYGDVNIEFYGTGAEAGDRDRSIEINQKGFATMVQAQTRITKNVYLGPRFQYLDLSSSIRQTDPMFPDEEIPTTELKSRLAQLGAVGSYDSRDSSLMPRTGEYINATWLFGVKGLGSDYSYNKFTLAANIYRPIAKKTVVAARASVCGVSSGGPFYDLCLYGASNDLRGYSTGQYRDQASWAAQFEIRQHLFWRLGAVAFAGVGGIAPKLTKLDEGRFLPSAGVGLRFQPSKSTPINLRVDFAVGKDSTAIYLSLGEAF